MACNELVELVTAYLDGALSRADRTRLEAHLADCEDCVTYVAQFRRTVEALGTVAAEPRPEPLSIDALLEVFRGRHQPL